MTNNKTTLGDILENPNKPIETMFEEKQAAIQQQTKQKQEFIKESQDKKQNSMRDFSIKRDAAMFAVAEYQSRSFFQRFFQGRKLLKELHREFINYFETIY